jgi:hypothetical protein
MNKFTALLLATLVVTVSNAALGTPFPYVFSGRADGNVAGTPFTGQSYTFTLISDTSTVQNASYVYSNVLTSGTVTITGTACAAGCSITNPGTYSVYNAGPYNGYGHGFALTTGLYLTGSTFLDACYDCSSTVVNDNLVTVIAPTVSGDEGVFAPYPALATSGGNVQLTALDSHVIYAAGVVVPAVELPTLSAWSFAILVVVLAAGAMLALRRRA